MNPMDLTDADMAVDHANYVLAEWEAGERPDNVAAEASYPCGCKAVRVHTIAGWQWVQAEACDDQRHRARGKRA